MRDDEETAAIPLAEETLHVSKRPVERRVRMRTVTEDVPELLREELRSERVFVDRVAVDRELDGPADVRWEGDVMIVPIVEERLIVEKRLFVVEELHIRRESGVERVETPVTLRRQRVVLDKEEFSGG